MGNDGTQVVNPQTQASAPVQPGPTGQPSPFDWDSVPPEAFANISPTVIQRMSDSLAGSDSKIFQRIGWAPMGRVRELTRRIRELESSRENPQNGSSEIDRILADDAQTPMTEESLDFKLSIIEANKFLEEKKIKDGSPELDRIKEILIEHGLDNSPRPLKVVKMAYKFMMDEREGEGNSGQPVRTPTAPQSAGSFNRGSRGSNGSFQYTRKLMREMHLKDPNWYQEHKDRIYAQIKERGPLPEE